MKIGWRQVQELIGTMNRNEKGYFKKYSAGFSSEKQSNYLLLFNLLDRNPSISDAAIKGYFSKKKIRTHLPGIRTYLYQLLLKSLRAYHSESSLLIRLRENFDIIEILGNKGLVQQALSHLEETRRIIEKEYLLPSKISLLFEHRHLLRFYAELEKEKIASEIHDSIMESADQLMRQDEISFIYARSIRLTNKYYPLRDVKIRKEVGTLLSKLRESEKRSPQNFVTCNALYGAYAMLYRLTGDLSKSAAYQEKTIEVYRSIDPERRSKNAGYISALFNRMGVYLALDDYDRVKDLLDEFEEEILNSKTELPLKWDAYYSTYLDYIVLSKRINEAIPALPTIEAYLQHHRNIQNLQLESASRIVVLYFMKHDLNKSLQWLNYILNAKYRHPTFSFLLHVRLMNILVHYELDNTLLLPSLIRNAFRFMMKHELEYMYEREILNFFTRLMNRVDRKQLLKMFEQLNKKLKVVLKDKAEQAVLSVYYNYTEWLDEKIKVFRG